MTSEIKEQIQKLTNKLDQANYYYYHLNHSILTDTQYDALLKKLILLEKKFPQYKLSYSPTFRVGGFLSSKFEKKKHQIPMLSLDNVFNWKEFENFYQRLLKKIDHFSLITELKIDGIAINVKYQKGILIQGITRGNGKIGELVTENIKTIKDIPLKIKEAIDLEVRGEIFFNYQAFQKLNQIQKEKNKPLFANPRNAASGTLRQLNTAIVAKRNLSSFFYFIVNPPSFLKTQLEILLFLKKMGFSVNPHYHLVSSLEILKAEISNYEILKQQLPYNTDGIVIKVNELSFYPKIGFTTKFPKWAIAYKFNSIQNITTIEKISFQIGRTGAITPIAHLVPVMIDGSLISKVTLHNYDYIQKKDIRLYDTVLIHKTGSIIPEIIEVVKTKRTNQIPFKMISNCPYCQSKLEKQFKEVNFFCLNENCSEKKIQKIIHFASRQAMNIDFLGKKNIIILFEKKIIQQISDLYNLKYHVKKITNLPFFGEKKIKNILSSLENSKNQTFDKILFGLGIKHVGLKIAQNLTQKFPNIDFLIRATQENLLSIPEIGNKISQSLKNYFQQSHNLKEINLLKMQGLFKN